MSRKQLARGGGDLSALGADDSGCTILHLDLDAFFVSAELLTRPDLRGRKVIVGGRAGRGVVVSASYEARADGVHAGMPMSRAVGLSPHAVVLPPSRGVYSRLSAEVFDIISGVTPDFAKVSVDEGYIDVRSALRRLGSPAQIAADLRARIEAETGLTASVGAASTMVVAKLASARAKPDGLLVVPVAEVDEFLRPMPVEALPGVGPSTLKSFAGYGILLISDLADSDPDWVGRVFGAHGRRLWEFAHGRDDRDLSRTPKDHSVSAERTFAEDVWDADVLERELLRLADGVASRLRGEGKAARAVGLKYRLDDFTTLSRSAVLPAPTDVASELWEGLLPALRRLRAERRRGVRLLGLRAHDLVDIAEAGRQVALEDADSTTREAQLALDEVRRRFGTASISAASLMDRPERG